nr:caspase family protein [Nocardia suismassiliense]
MATSLRDLEQRLRDSCQIRPEHIRVVLDPPDPVAFYAHLRATAAEATDVLLIYYVGHGLKRDNELFLATAATTDITKNRAASEALEFAAIPAVLAQSTARTMIVVLDCCYSGLARLDSRVDNGLLLVSATQFEPALYQAGAPHTVFTGALLATLAAGDPDGPPLTTLGRLTDLLDRALSENKSSPCRPVIEFRGNASRLVVAENHAHKRPEQEDPADTAATDGINPYRGLFAYEKGDAPMFFGRTATVAALARTIADRATDLVVLTGASGVGKSSVLGAGLLPLLDVGDELPGSETWRQVALTPGADPLDALRSSLAKALRISREAVTELLADATLLNETCTATPIAVLVDQFEDVFAHHLADADEFIETLTRLARVARLTVVCVRSDFLGRCLRYPMLGPAARAAVEVAPMSLKDLRAVITEPAILAGLVVADDLVEVILSDAAPRADRSVEVLPLLSHALAATWRERRDRVLTVADYIRAGRIDKAVAKTAEAVYDGLDENGKEEARQLFLALLTVDGNVRTTSRVVELAELELDATGATVLDAFVRARLIGVGGGNHRVHRCDQADRGTVFLIHDAVLEAWDQLRDWIAQHGAATREWQRVRSRATEWSERKRHPALLLSGPALDTALLLRTRPIRLSKPEREYLDASARRQRFTTRLKFATIMSLVLLTVFSVAGATLAFDHQAKATASANDAAVQQLQLLGKSYADTNPRAALSFLLAAARRSPTDKNHAVLARALISSPFGGRVTMPDLTEGYDAVEEVALSPDGRLLAAADETGQVALWRIEGHELSDTAIGRLKVRQVHELRFDATGRKLVVFGNEYDRSRPVDQRERNVWWWDVSDPAHPALDHVDGGGGIGAVSPDGTTGVRIVSAGDKSVTTLVRIGEQITEGARLDSPGLMLGFSKDNSLLVTADDAGLALWDTSDLGNPIRLANVSTALSVDTDPAQFTMVTGGTRDFASFSPDNRLVAIGGRGAAVTLIDLTDRARPKAVSTLADAHRIALIEPSATRAEFSPSGHTLTMGGSGAGVQLWDVRDPLHPHVIRSLGTELAGQIRALAYSANGRSLVSGGLGGEVALWNVESGTGVVVDKEFEARGDDGYLSPDGMTLIVDEGPVSLDDPGTLAIWRLTDPARPAVVGRIPQHAERTAHVSIARDGHLAAVRNGDGSTSLWSLIYPANPVLVGTAATNSMIGMTFPNTHTMTVRMDHAGKRLAVERENNQLQRIVQVWDISDPAHTKPVADIVTAGWNPPSYTLSPDGRMLAATVAATGTELWDVSGRNQPKLRAQLPGDAASLALSPDGRVLFRTGRIGDEQGTELFDLTDPTVPKLRKAVPDKTGSPAFSADGRIFATASGRDLILSPTDNLESTFGLPGHLGTVTALRLRPDGLLVSRDPRNVRIWDVRGATRTLIDPVTAACARLGSAVSDRIWQHYAPNLPYDNVCG